MLKSLTNIEISFFQVRTNIAEIGPHLKFNHVLLYK